MPGNIVYRTPVYGYAGIFTWHSALALVMPSAAVTVRLDGLRTDGWAVGGDVLGDGPGGTITVLRRGAYKYGFTVSGDSNKLAEIHIGCHVNDVLVEQVSNGVLFGTSAKLHEIAMSGILELQAGDEVSARIYSDTDLTTLTIEHANMFVNKIAAPIS